MPWRAWNRQPQTVCVLDFCSRWQHGHAFPHHNFFLMLPPVLLPLLQAVQFRDSIGCLMQVKSSAACHPVSRNFVQLSVARCLRIVFPCVAHLTRCSAFGPHPGTIALSNHLALHCAIDCGEFVLQSLALCVNQRLYRYHGLPTISLFALSPHLTSCPNFTSTSVTHITARAQLPPGEEKKLLEQHFGCLLRLQVHHLYPLPLIGRAIRGSF